MPDSMPNDGQFDGKVSVYQDVAESYHITPFDLGITVLEILG